MPIHELGYHRVVAVDRQDSWRRRVGASRPHRETRHTQIPAHRPHPDIRQPRRWAAPEP